MNLNFPARITANVPFQDQIQEPYFEPFQLLNPKGSPVWHCFMLMPPLMDNTWPIIQYTVTTQSLFLQLIWLLRLL